MGLIYSTKRGDTARPLTILMSRSDQSPIDLTGKVGRFLMRQRQSAVVVINAEATLDNIAKTASYQFTPAQAAQVGEYLAEFEIRNEDGTEPETFPGTDVWGNPLYIKVFFRPDVGDAP